MNHKLGSILIGWIVFVMATALMLLLPDSANLYVGYGFFVAHIIVIAVCVVMANMRHAIESYALLQQTSWGVVASVNITTLVLLVQNTYTIPPIWHSLFQLMPLALFSIRAIKISISQNYIEKIDRQTTHYRGQMEDRMNTLSSLQFRVNALPEDVRNDAQKALKSVADSLRFSDPMSTSAVRVIDAEIDLLLDRLPDECAAPTISTFIETCALLYAAINERKRVLKASKS